MTRDEAPRHADSAGGGIQKAGLHLATGAREGEPPTPRSIEQGTVRMEEHPEYEQVVNELHRAGYVVVHTEHDPHVVVRCVVDRQGKVLKTEHEVRVKPGMRFLDLEHELGHVRQLTDPARFPDGPPCTQYVFERPNGVRIKAKLHGPELKTWQDASIEYHVRLQELLRLSARGVDREVLEEHAEGVLKWKATFQKETHRNGESTMRSAWSRRHFPDIPELARQVFSDTDLFPRGAVDQQLFHGPEPIGGQDAPE